MRAMIKRGLRGLLLALFVVADFVSPCGATPPPVLIGLDAEFGHRTSTSAVAIRQGILLALEEINAAGGVLEGRKLELVERDNRSVPARGEVNIRELAALPDLVAVFCGKFSPVVQEILPTVHALKIPLLDPWAAMDSLVDNGYTPNFVFRLSLRDSWAVPTLLEHANHRGLRRLGILAPNTGWGRSSVAAARHYASRTGLVDLIGDVGWYNWGDTHLLTPYLALKAGGAQGILLIANETEGAILVREVAALPEGERVPFFSHWGVSGGNFPAMTGEALAAVDFSLVQTFTFAGTIPARAQAVLSRLQARFTLGSAATIPSQVGIAHAYDLTHILAAAIRQAGSTDRQAIRDALESLPAVDGLIRRYDPPFTPNRHEALEPAQVFIGRFSHEGIVPLAKAD